MIHEKTEEPVIQKLVDMYEKGAITADHLVIECLHRVDPEHPEVVLDALPPLILERMLHYAHEYKPQTMRTNYGLQPAGDQVEAAKRWIECRAKQPPGSASDVRDGLHSELIAIKPSGRP
jgi:hypothetical protein